MLNAELQDQGLHSTPDKNTIAVVSCSMTNGVHSSATFLMTENCRANGLIPHTFFFSPHSSPFLLNKKFLFKSGLPFWVGGSSPQASFEIVQMLGQYGSRAWLGIAPNVPENYSVTREGLLYLWKQRPARDIVYNDQPMDDALINWAFDYLKFAKLVICQTEDEKILYPSDVNVISQSDATRGLVNRA